MANIESDATYCSEVEKENLSQRRRSKRLSQKAFPSFRSNGDPTSLRFEEIHKMVTSDTFCKDRSKHDWLALKCEIDILKKSLKRVAKSRIIFVEEKITKHLQKLSVPFNSNDDAVECQYDRNNGVSCEIVKSPNVLAGMMTEVLTELPPYQPQNLSKIMGTNQKPNSNNSLTQVNPLDLTKKIYDLAEKDSIQVEPGQGDALKEPKTTQKDKTSVIDKSKDSMIDLTDDDVVEINQENLDPVNHVHPASTKKPIHTSKWLKYLESPKKTKPLYEKPKNPSPPKGKPNSFKESLIKLYKENPISITKARESTSTRSTNKQKGGFKSTVPRHTENAKKQPVHNTERTFRREFESPNVPPRNAQTEQIQAFSPDSFIEGFIAREMPLFKDDESVSSMPLSLKESFKKIFGTDSLNEVFGFEHIVYSLTERHVERLAKALNMKDDILKRTIEQILAVDGDNNLGLFEEDMGSGSSVVECSQSPKQRLFPSQRSQISK